MKYIASEEHIRERKKIGRLGLEKIRDVTACVTFVERVGACLIQR